ncbi:MAG: hypothetical protein JWR80_5502 [Bradyrhizobium sp.]|nr:hypothetical protein [Bradyrhizobium sp.]
MLGGKLGKNQQGKRWRTGLSSSNVLEPDKTCRR